MGIKKGSSRSQLRMLSLEEAVKSDDMARVIDLFVEALDMDSFGFDDKGKSKVGSLAFSNKVMLKIYLLGYRNKVRSTRELEKACRYDLRFWWIANTLKPKYRVIADFRKNNKSSFKKVFTSFTKFLQSNGLISGAVVAIDGTKIKASNSRMHNYSEKKLTKQLNSINKQIEDYLKQLDEADSVESKQEKEDKLKELKSRKAVKEQLQNQLKASDESQISTVDPDARLMQTKLTHTDIVYNVQATTDSDNSLLVDFDVTNQTDRYALSDCAKSAKEILGLEKMIALADAGYYTGSELKKCKKELIETFVSPVKRRGKNDSDYWVDKFKYDPEKDLYFCPENEELKTDGKWHTQNKNQKGKSPYKMQIYKVSFTICKNCPVREKCLSKSSIKNRMGRKIERSEYETIKEANNKRIAENKELYRTRKQIVEHPFGTIKRSWGMHYTNMRTKGKVEADIALAFLTYNLVRATNILDIEVMISKLKNCRISFRLFEKLIDRLFKRYLNKQFETSYVI